MSFIGADLFRMDGEPAYPSAYDYYRKPSFGNARKLLETFGIYVPYEATRALAAAAAAAAAAPPGGPGAARGGGTKRSRARVSPTPTASASPPPASDAVSIFQRADFLHDVHVNAPLNSIVTRRVLAEGVQIPDALRQRLLEHCASRDASAYTQQATVSLDAHFGFSASLLRVSDLRDPLAIRRQHILADAYMRDKVSEWLTANDDGIAEIVFDGILEDPIAKPASNGIHEETHLRSLATCAFLQWMIGEWPEPYGAGRSGARAGGVSEIRFLTGTFQTLDVAGHDAFFNRWVGYLRRDASALKSVGLIRAVRLDVAAVQSGTPGVALAPGGDEALIVRGHRVPFFAKRASEWSPKNEAERLKRFLESSPALQVTYAKGDLVDMFQYYITLTDSQRADARVEAAVAQAIAVNSFRDAFKADVALARGAVYLTVDRLALVYYELRRRALGAKSRGLAMTTTKNRADGDTMDLKTYRSAPRAAEP
jgi:hypothetical protein